MTTTKTLHIITIGICFLIIITGNTIPTAHQNSQNIYQKILHTDIEIHHLLKTNPSNTPTILLPRSTVPTFVEPGGTFMIAFTAEPFDHLASMISTAYEPVINEIWLNTETTTKENNTWYLTVSVPNDTPIELYNLTFIIDHNGEFFSTTEPRAVSVIKEFSKNISFIHIADFHAGDPRGFTENISQTFQLKSIKKCIDEINLLHPDFVLISGDLVFGQLYPFEYSREYRICYDLLQRFDVPTFLCPGNHDGYNKPGQDGFTFWKYYFGPLYYSFDYGMYHFIAANSYDWPSYSRRAFGCIPITWGGSIQDEQLQWIEQDLAHTTTNHTYLFLHHNPLWETTQESLIRKPYANRQELCDLINKYNIDMVLAGHVHWDNVTKVNTTIYLTTTTPSSSTRTPDGYWGYRLITLTNGTISSYNYKEPKYSIPSYHLFSTKNTPYETTVKSMLEQPLKVLVKFLVPQGNYTVNTGDIILTRQNAYQKEIYVQTHMENQSTVTISLSSIE